MSQHLSDDKVWLTFLDIISRQYHFSVKEIERLDAIEMAYFLNLSFWRQEEASKPPSGDEYTNPTVGVYSHG